MKKLFTLVAIAGLAFSTVGCAEKPAAPPPAAPTADAPADAPAAAPADAPAEDKK